MDQESVALEFSFKIKENLVESIKKFLENQIINARRHHQDRKQYEIEYKDITDRLEKVILLLMKSKTKFHQLAKSAEMSKLECEIAKNNQHLSSDNKKKMHNVAFTKLKEAQETEKIYIENLTKANNFREKYIEFNKSVLNDFQSMEEQFIDFTRNCMKDYLEMIKEFSLKSISTLDDKIDNILSINSTLDIKEFIEHNATNSMPPYKFEFVPYSSDVQTKPIDMTPYPAEIINNVKNFISTSFFSEMPYVENDPQEMKINSEIQSILNTAWDGKQLKEEERKQFNKFIKEKRYRRYFLSCINKYRIKGLFTLDEVSYQTLGDLLLLLLDETFKEKDFESAKYTMIISQTFYKNSDDINDPRIILQQHIEGHEIWKRIEFWEGIIKYSIHEEAHNQKFFNAYGRETEMEKAIRLSNIAFGQLFSFAYNMLSFQIPKTKVKEVITSFSKIFNVDEEMKSQIFKMVEEFTEIVDQQIKMDILEDNISMVSEDICEKNLDMNVFKNFLDKEYETDLTSANPNNI